MKTFYHAASNSHVTEGLPFTLQDVQYPANWLTLASAEDRAALDLQEVTTVGTRADDRYFWVSEQLQGAVRTIVNEPKDPDLVRSKKNGDIQERIDALERKELLPRLVRTDLLVRAEKDAAALGLTLDQVYAMASQPNPPTAAITYKKLKDFDDSIAELRSQFT